MPTKGSSSVDLMIMTGSSSSTRSKIVALSFAGLAIMAWTGLVRSNHVSLQASTITSIEQGISFLVSTYNDDDSDEEDEQDDSPLPIIDNDSSTISDNNNQEPARLPLSEFVVNNEIRGDVQFLLDFCVLGHSRTGTTSIVNWLNNDDKSIAILPAASSGSLHQGKPAKLVQDLYQLPAKQPAEKRGFKSPPRHCRSQSTLGPGHLLAANQNYRWCPASRPLV